MKLKIILKKLRNLKRVYGPLYTVVKFYKQEFHNDREGLLYVFEGGRSLCEIQ
jgi:hypothetical protein